MLLLNWIKPQLNGKIIHINCCKINKEKNKIERIHNHKIEIVNENNTNQIFKIYNFENFNILHLKNYDLTQIKEIKESDSVLKIAIIRSPWNWFASVVKQKPNAKINKYYPQIINLYNNYLEYIIKVNMFNIEPIIFDEWFSNKIYRENISFRLGLPFSDDGLNIVSKFGNGSSFDILKYNGNAQEMKVLDRWKQLSGKELIIFNKFKETLNDTYWNNK